MAERIVFQSSLYPQFEIEIDGQVFAVRAVDRAAFDLLRDMMKQAEAGDPDAIGKMYDQVTYILQAPKEFIDKLDYRVVRAVMKTIDQKIIRAELEEEEKKESKPGEKPTPQ